MQQHSRASREQLHFTAAPQAFSFFRQQEFTFRFQLSTACGYSAKTCTFSVYGQNEDANKANNRDLLLSWRWDFLVVTYATE